MSLVIVKITIFEFVETVVFCDVCQNHTHKLYKFDKDWKISFEKKLFTDARMHDRQTTDTDPQHKVFGQ